MNKTKAIVVVVATLLVMVAVSGYYLGIKNQQEEEPALNFALSLTTITSEPYCAGDVIKHNHTEAPKFYAEIDGRSPTNVWWMLNDCGYYDCGENDPMRHYWSEILDDDFGGDVERMVVETYTKNWEGNTVCDVDVIYHYVSFDCVKVEFGVRNETNYNSLLDCFAEKGVKYEEG